MAAAEGVATAYWVNNDRFLNHLNAYLPQRPWWWLMGMLICILKILLGCICSCCASHWLLHAPVLSPGPNSTLSFEWENKDWHHLNQQCEGKPRNCSVWRVSSGMQTGTEIFWWFCHFKNKSVIIEEHLLFSVACEEGYNGTDRPKMSYCPTLCWNREEADHV